MWQSETKQLEQLEHLERQSNLSMASDTWIRIFALLLGQNLLHTTSLLLGASCQMRKTHILPSFCYSVTGEAVPDHTASSETPAWLVSSVLTESLPTTAWYYYYHSTKHELKGLLQVKWKSKVACCLYLNKYCRIWKVESIKSFLLNQRHHFTLSVKTWSKSETGMNPRAQQVRVILGIL